mmetsp:Transcript_6395/g.9706  ORF Transcript_6395/g.9706 Transcript_6395/m.9706 type:complete len:248 (+) Transcript_6395:216-959(+)
MDTVLLLYDEYFSQRPFTLAGGYFFSFMAIFCMVAAGRSIPHTSDSRMRYIITSASSWHRLSVFSELHWGSPGVQASSGWNWKSSLSSPTSPVRASTRLRGRWYWPQSRASTNFRRASRTSCMVEGSQGWSGGQRQHLPWRWLALVTPVSGLYASYFALLPFARCAGYFLAFSLSLAQMAAGRSTWQRSARRKVYSSTSASSCPTCSLWSALKPERPPEHSSALLHWRHSASSPTSPINASIKFLGE